MNLGKLLGAGKSVFGGQAPAEYRKSKHVYLPKFNEGKNPFSTKAPEPTVPVSAPMPAPAASKMVVAAPIAPAPIAVAAAVAVAPVVPVTPAAPGPAAALAPVGAPAMAAPAKSIFSAPSATPTPAPAPKNPVKTARAAHWTERLNQLWSAAKPASPAAPSGPMPNVQPELLSLNSVKVVHNDLSDADVEVVPMKSRTVQAKTTPMPSVSMDFVGEPALKSV